MTLPLHSRTAPRYGAIMVMMVVALPLVLILAAFAIDVAWMQLVRSELRTATDAASRAGAKTLSIQQSESAARNAARDAANRNIVAGTPLRLNDSDIEIGLGSQTSRTSRFVFAPSSTIKNAVRVTGNRTASSAGGPVSLFLGRVTGVNTFEPSYIATATQLDRDICLVVDRSGSMMSELIGSSIPGDICDPPHSTLSRWGNLNTAVLAFVDELDQTSQIEQCGLVSYSEQGTSCDLTYTTSDIDAVLDVDYQPVRDAMARLSSQPVGGFTNIAAGIDNGIAVLTDTRSRVFAFKTMVLMTDGIKNRGIEPVIEARRAKREGIVIHTVTFSDQADIARMQDVANATGGQHFHAPDAAELVRIFREIASTLPVMLTD